jgi:hypothetical protein
LSSGTRSAFGFTGSSIDATGARFATLAIFARLHRVAA